MDEGIGIRVEGVDMSDTSSIPEDARKRRHRAAQARYQASDKGKATQARYWVTDKGKATQTRYHATEKGKTADGRHNTKRQRKRLQSGMMLKQEQIKNLEEELRRLLNG